MIMMKNTLFLNMKINIRFRLWSLLLLVSAFVNAQRKPNIVMIMVDDLPYFDPSYMHRGLASYQTPNIDRIANEGMIISDYYGQPSCTAGRASIITGQYPIRTGLTSVGQPGAKVGLHKEDPTLAELLKPLGYKTALFGKWHLGDRNEFLPTVHGFDEFYGFMYHLNMMEMPEQEDFPKDPNFAGRPRNMVHSWASSSFDSTVEGRWGIIGNQKVQDEGPLTKDKMGDIDEIFGAAASKWMEKNKDDPFFLWFNPSRMHQKIHVTKKWLGKSGMSEYADAVMQMDYIVGLLLNKLKELKLEENTIVLFTSDNGVNLAHWPEAGTSGFRGEKGTTWDGAYRVPMVVRWPGKIPAGKYTGGFMTSEDWVPTLLSAAGSKNIKSELQSGKYDYKVHLDGYDQIDMITKNAPSNRHEFFYYAESTLTAIRVDQWKTHLATKDSWLAAPTKIDGGLLINIKLDPFERTPGTSGHFEWMTSRSWVAPLFQSYVEKFQKSMLLFPPRQKGTGIGASTIFSSN
jgi:arylsulfatase